MKDFGLYIVMTQPKLGYERFTKICVEEELPMLQLREKSLCDRDLLELAIKLNALCHGTKTKFFINDRIDICLLAGIQGIHLGQDDIPWYIAKKLLPDSLMGVSTHSIAQFQKISAEIQSSDFKPDYISFGPIYPTSAKAKPDPVVGCSLLTKVISHSKLPVVAIGGIFEDKIQEILATGAKNFCMIRYFGQCESEESLKHRIRQMMNIRRKS